MFDHSHYVPILRWKHGEKRALAELYIPQKNNITPLIELIPKNFEKCKNSNGIRITSEEIAESIELYWGNNNIFLDFGNLENTSLRNLDGLALAEITDYNNSNNLNIIPVTTLYKSRSFQNAVSNFIKRNKSGLCLRINYNSIFRANFLKELKQLLNYYRIKNIDLVVDYGIMGNNPDPDIFTNICARIPNITSWRTFTFVSGAYPKYLDMFRPGQHILERDDWNYWLKNIQTTKLQRIPTFSDFTIRHPIHTEAGVGFNVSASIKYTSDNYWVIMRGEGVRNPGGSGFAQYPANALLLMNRNEFCGAGYSYGDDYIIEKGNNLNGKPGSHETWLTAGINHHITFVVDQLSSLSGS